MAIKFSALYAFGGLSILKYNIVFLYHLYYYSLYTEAVIEKNTLFILIILTVLFSWNCSKENTPEDAHEIQKTTQEPVAPEEPVIEEKKTKEYAYNANSRYIAPEETEFTKAYPQNEIGTNDSYAYVYPFPVRFIQLFFNASMKPGKYKITAELGLYAVPIILGKDFKNGMYTAEIKDDFINLFGFWGAVLRSP
jgi:hypothetical protein